MNPSFPHGKLKHTLWLGGLTVGAAVLCLGLAVIFGWHTGNRALVQILPTFVPMQYNTALGFVFCGTGILLLVFRRERWAGFAGFLALLVGGLTLVE